jgi:hypothetical protein
MSWLHLFVSSTAALLRLHVLSLHSKFLKAFVLQSARRISWKIFKSAASLIVQPAYCTKCLQRLLFKSYSSSSSCTAGAILGARGHLYTSAQPNGAAFLFMTLPSAPPFIAFFLSTTIKTYATISASLSIIKGNIRLD